MPVYKSLTVKDIPFFKDATLDLATPGLTVILGLNTNDPAKHASTNSNFVGKSLLLSQIPDIVFRDGLAGKAKDKAKRGERVLELDTDEGAHVIRHYYKGATEYLQITRNGEDITPASQVAQRELAERLIGRDQMSYQVLDYLDNTKPHPLRVGDTGQRRVFFTKFFQLAAADHMKRLVDAEKDTLKQDGARRAELLEQLATLKVPEDCEDALAAAQKQLATTQRRLDALREARDQSRWAAMRVEALALLNRKDTQDASDVELQVTKRQARLVKAKAQRETVRAQREAVSAYRAYRKALAARTAYVQEHGLHDDAKAARSELRKLQDTLEAHRSAQSERAGATAKYEARLELLKDRVADARAAIVAFESESKNCSRCGRPLTAAHRAIEQAALDEELASARNALKSHKASSPEVVYVGDVDTDKLTKDIRVLQDRLDLWNDAPAMPEAVDKPDAEVDGDEDLLSDVIDKLRTEKALLSSLLADADQLATWLSGDSVKYDDAEYDRLSQSLLDCQSAISDLTTRVAERKQIREQRRALKERVQKLDAVLLDYDAVLLLEKAFASNAHGVKSMVIRGLCEALETQVNRYARFLFPEDYTFAFNLETQFDITVTRKFGKTELTSDVRKLSGAEAGLFNILLVVALTTFLPQAHRSNLLVLDEVDANFSPAMTDAFIRFLPILNKAIPHIIVITPKSADYGENARYITVVKKGATSRLYAGRPGAVAQQLVKRKVK